VQIEKDSLFVRPLRPKTFAVDATGRHPFSGQCQVATCDPPFQRGADAADRGDRKAVAKSALDEAAERRIQGAAGKTGQAVGSETGN
jgi:hypothetical protein